VTANRARQKCSSRQNAGPSRASAGHRTGLGWASFQAIIIGFLTSSAAAPAAAGETVEVTPLLTTRQTASGQPILLPQRDVQVVVSRFVISRFVLQPGTTQ